MAFHKFFKAIGERKSIEIYGSGNQTRDFTYIDDIVKANISAVKKGKSGEVYNLGGGIQHKLSDIIPLLQEICGKKVIINKVDNQKGDVKHTYADISKAKKDLLYNPRVNLKEGLEKEWSWIKEVYSFK
jgi:UDP-glucose 4-epimerase